MKINCKISTEAEVSMYDVVSVMLDHIKDVSNSEMRTILWKRFVKTFAPNPSCNVEVYKNKRWWVSEEGYGHYESTKRHREFSEHENEVLDLIKNLNDKMF